VRLPVTEGADELVAAVKALGDAGIAIDDIALRRPTLDDVFLTLTGHTTEDADDASDSEEKIA
jgi:ABC-2 type transport system ATP-binding protein